MSAEPINPDKKGCIEPPQNTTHEFKEGFSARLWGRSFDSNPYFFHSGANIVMALAARAWDRGYITADNKLAQLRDSTGGRT